MGTFDSSTGARWKSWSGISYEFLTSLDAIIFCFGEMPLRSSYFTNQFVREVVARLYKSLRVQG
ncbi:hypothetical protein CIK64_18575 [Brevibacterium aurantiacum]|uniref:Uncharacterized protein n=1 Tax=Brevibacterium aurantiacum TaxID=273384 RepID=A0A2A3Z028_BREAU|nr:hypothetical protein CIK64_18575 [Brevibacterium aurantiacum]